MGNLVVLIKILGVIGFDWVSVFVVIMLKFVEVLGLGGEIGLL